MVKTNGESGEDEWRKLRRRMEKVEKTNGDNGKDEWNNGKDEWRQW